MNIRYKNRVQFKAPSLPPTIEFDPSAMAWYVRFRNAKVAKTISPESSGPICAIDLDAKNEVIGVELIGVPEFRISEFRAIPGLDTSKVDFEKARFLSASSREPVPA